MSDANPRNLDQFGIPLDRAGQTDPNDAIRSAFNDFLIEGDRQNIQVRGRANRWIISFQPDPVQPVEASGGDEGSGALLSDFAVLILNNMGTYYRGVYKNSTVIQSFDHTDTVSISGLLSSLNPTPSDPGWIATSTTDSVWIETDVNSGVDPFTFSNFAIKSLVNGDSFGGGEIENDGGMPGPDYNQTKARLVLADMVDNGSGVPIIGRRWVYSPLRMEMNNYLDSNDSSGGSDQLVVAAYFFPTG